MFPVMEMIMYEDKPGYIGDRFGVPFQSDDRLWYTYSVTTVELLSIYFINVDSNRLLSLLMDNIVKDLLLFSIMCTFRQNTMLDSDYSAQFWKMIT